ncbi:hypothetical protein AVDCRST_MAG94-5862, partial [uncultured Leptolyngbya sp.]
MSKPRHLCNNASASSSVGYSAIQIAKAAGAVAIVTTRSNTKKQMLLAKGADPNARGE